MDEAASFDANDSPTRATPVAFSNTSPADWQDVFVAEFGIRR